MHTPAQLYGDRLIGEVMSDEIWLRDVGPNRWVVLGRDTTILKTPHELAAYKAARIHMFLFPGNATRPDLVATLRAVLNDICMHSSAGKPSVWRVHGMPRPRLEQL